MKPLLHARTAAAVDAISPQSTASYIFYGAKSSGKRLAAQYLAARLNCAGDGDDGCAICRQVQAGNYPDFITVAPLDKPSISIEQIRRLLSTLSLAPYRAGGTRLVVIDAAETLTTEAQNALLKNLEEPPTGTRYVLISQSLEALIPTVRSRLAAVYFAPVASGPITTWLEQRHGLRPVDAGILAQLAGGVVGEAVILATNPELAARWRRLDETATQLFSANRFGRLQAVRRLADDKLPAADLLRVLHRRAVVAIKDGQAVDTGHRQLAAVASARRLLGAGVMARVVLDRLTLEL